MFFQVTPNTTAKCKAAPQPAKKNQKVLKNQNKPQKKSNVIKGKGITAVKNKVNVAGIPNKSTQPVQRQLAKLLTELPNK